MKVTPKTVSILVVKVSIFSFFKNSLTSKDNVTPLDLPIQFFCMIFIFSGQSIESISNNSSAYFVMAKNH